ncbi:hypothetical protein BUALT_Bualt17G0021600 [Buddleja alternifolia]|uniref:Spt6 SH2 domain-containing protein n=1 Tax=Buddleja alternifolia TaxID=168488 RepID=A0AAV6WB09_9LAMI|nr:hypothetical protein BUALT_Bualt17G0021600 [Buddleja alternifolia]
MCWPVFFTQVMYHYVDPLVAYLKEMLNYRKFRKGTRTEVDELLKNETDENPMRIVYCFGICHEHPVTFILTYIRGSNPHHEYIGLSPKGFNFRNEMFKKTDHLVAYFQKYIDNDPYESASIRSVSARVPMRSPATWGSSGFGGGFGASTSDGGGWRGEGSGRVSGYRAAGRGGDHRDGGQDRHSNGAPRPRSGHRDGGQDRHSNGAPRPRSGRGRGQGGLIGWWQGL